jgi:hypothetical protein
MRAPVALLSLTLLGGVGLLLVRQSDDRAQLLRLSAQLDTIARAAGERPQLLVAAPGRDADPNAVAVRVLAGLHQPSAPAQAVHGDEPAAPVELPPERQQAAQAAQQQLDQAIARGSMSRQEMTEIRRQLAVANDPAQTDALLLRMSVAINEQRLVPPHGAQ